MIYYWEWLWRFFFDRCNVTQNTGRKLDKHRTVFTDHLTMLDWWPESETNIIRLLTGHLTHIVGCPDDGRPKKYKVITITCMVIKWALAPKHLRLAMLQQQLVQAQQRPSVALLNIYGYSSGNWPIIRSVIGQCLLNTSILRLIGNRTMIGHTSADSKVMC